MSVLSVVHLLLVAVLASQVRSRVASLRSFGGLSGWLLSFGLTLFLVNWADFLLYTILGWGVAYSTCTWLILAALVAWFARVPLATASLRAPREYLGLLHSGLDPRRWNFWFLVFAGCVLARFYFGVDTDDEGQTWVIFNFVDTGYHLSVANAFLEAPRFPPVDLDMPPFPLKYHFLADFSLAHLIQLGAIPLTAIWTMNLLGAAALVGSLWALFERWLKLPARWVMLAGFIFLFLNTALVNVIHYLAFRPPYFDPAHFFPGVIRFPYFNFESHLANLLEPQRGLLFTMPVVLFVMHLLFGAEALPEPSASDDATAGQRFRLVAAFAIICLLPLAHIVGFAVLAVAAAPALLREWRWFFARYRWWLPFFVVGLCQLLYLLLYGPPTSSRYSGWDVAASLPLDEFRAFPALLRRPLFWFFVNGDFFGWSLVLGGIALLRARLARTDSAGATRLRTFLHDWRWYFAACVGFFALINVYRYAYAWGDSNKFVLFLNLGLTLIIVFGAAQWTTGRRPWISHTLWTVLLIVAATPATVTFCRRVILYPNENILFFHRHEIAAAKWLKDVAGPKDYVLTAAYTDSHFVSPLAAQPALAGIYGDSNPNRRYGRGTIIRRVFEKDAVALLPKLGVRYVCISRTERRVYKLDPHWHARMESGNGVVFHSGAPDEFESVFIFDVQALK